MNYHYRCRTAAKPQFYYLTMETILSTAREPSRNAIPGLKLAAWSNGNDSNSQYRYSHTKPDSSATPYFLFLNFSLQTLLTLPTSITSNLIFLLRSLSLCLSSTMFLKLLLLVSLLERANSWAASNMSNEFIAVENAYMKWVTQQASMKQPVFQKRKNKFKPCRIIKVNKNPRLGDFVTVQKAINSLPVVNLCRVVIYISSGIYR